MKWAGLWGHGPHAPDVYSASSANDEEVLFIQMALQFLMGNRVFYLPHVVPFFHLLML